MTDSTDTKKKFTEEQQWAIDYFNEVDAHLGDKAYWTARADGEGYTEEDAAYWDLPRWEALEASHSDNSLDTLKENGLTVGDTLPNY
tara:strand:+ start:125 stop:385 length:261 start_codon:yes stop_codon:yes gene_type:complete